MSHSQVRLGVNIDHIATIRQARGTSYPDIVEAAREAEAGGADSITVHLREDRRHIQDVDVQRLRATITTRLNLEMAATPQMLRIASEIRPEVCCIVPEKREELTTEGGLDVVGGHRKIASICERLAATGIEVSLFIDPDPAQVDRAAELAPTVELHTGRYADADSDAERARELDLIAAALRRGRGAGLRVNAGHGLHYDNVSAIASLDGVAELNIGHAIVARAVFTGLRSAVSEMKALLGPART